MTDIRVRFRPPGSSDTVPGVITFTARHVDGNRPVVDGQDIILGQPQRFDVPTEGATISLRPTGPGWYYAVTGRADGHSFSTQKLVPPTGPVDFESLVRFDPKVGLAYEPDPQWWSHLDVIDAGLLGTQADLHAARDSAEADALTAQSSASAAVTARDEAVVARDETLAHGITVDTSVGTRVSIGGHVIHYDSGWRIIPASMTPEVVSGHIRIRRTLDMVLFDFQDAVLPSGSSSPTVVTGLPAGWRTSSTGSLHFVSSSTNWRWEHYLRARGSGVTWYARFQRHTTTQGSVTTDGLPLTGTFTAAPDSVSTLPSSLIGTPA